MLTNIYLHCCRTYLAKRRLSKALSTVRDDPEVKSSGTTFTLKFVPYQLYPEASKEGEDKTGWYKKSRYGDNDEKWGMYTKIMSSYGRAEGINFKFGGTVANTFDAHRLIQWVQEEKGGETADKVVDSLYSQYFENERHPSSRETLLQACKDAGVDEKQAIGVIDDESEMKMEVRNLIQQQKNDGIDAVPYIVVEGKRRDFTFEGAKEVKDYEKALRQVVKES